MKSTFKGGTKMTGGHMPANPNPPVISGNPKVVKSAKGKSHFADGGVVTGKKTAMRLDRPGRKMGGRVGADCAPLSSAASTSNRDDGKQSN